MQLNSPYGYSPEGNADFVSLKSSCKVPTTAYPVTYTPSPSDPSTTPPPGTAPKCLSSYITKNGDSLSSISKSRNMANDAIIAQNANLLLSGPDKLSAGLTLCFDNVQTCVLQQVEANATCPKLISTIGGGVTTAMLQSWNPTIHKNCDNLDTMVGKYICASPPGTSSKVSISTPPADSSTANITSVISDAEWTTLPPEAVITAPPKITTKWIFDTFTPNITTATNVFSGRNVDKWTDRLDNCPFFKEEPEDPEREISLELPEGCYSSWIPYCEVTDLSGPILPSPTDIPSSCYTPIETPKPSITTPSGPPGPTPPTTPKNCNAWRLVKSGDSCQSVASSADITLEQLLSYNPSLNAACTNLAAGVAYCVVLIKEPGTQLPPPNTVTLGPPSGAPTAPGTSKACKAWHVAKSDDTCQSIISVYGIPLQRLRQLNRDLNTDCTNVKSGNAYCVRT